MCVRLQEREKKRTRVRERETVCARVCVCKRRGKEKERETVFMSVGATVSHTPFMLTRPPPPPPLPCLGLMKLHSVELLIWQIPSLLPLLPQEEVSSQITRFTQIWKT